MESPNAEAVRRSMSKFTKQEERLMWEFLLKEIVDPVTGLIERDRIKAKGLAVWEKFRVEMNDFRSATSLRKKYSMAGFPSPQMMNFDVDSQVKLHYALGIPVDETQLNELLEHADVDLDEYSCIVRYKDRRPGGLELRQFVRHRKRKREELEDEIMSHMKIPLNGDWAGIQIDKEGGSREGSVDGEAEQQEQNPQNSLQSLWSALGMGGANSNGFVKKEEIDDVPEKAVEVVTVGAAPATTSSAANEIDTKVYLDNLNTFVSRIGSTELEGVQLKIAKAMGSSEGKKLPMEKVKMMMEATLAMMGF